MSDNEKIFKPTVKSQPSLKVQVPNTPEGREFLEKLRQLLRIEELPFVQSCPSQHGHAIVAAAMKPAAAGSSTGSTSYALDLRIEQEGFAP
ncbi:hypothetical protein [Terriglobus sp.]|uniref:hypothetical protein n=1 Tax=Terriglobus sp. TaxID=1889013 RepID=UPI003B00854C